MNEEMNDGSKKRGRPKGQVLDMLEASPNVKTKTTKNRLELLITEEQLQVWDLLADGRTGKQVAKELGIAPSTVGTRMRAALKLCRGWAGKEAEDWRNHQLLILEKQISGLIDDTNIQATPKTNEDGEQEYSKAGVPLWIIAPVQAGKVRNMARQTLRTFLDHQAKLLNLMVDRKEITVDQRSVIAVYNLGEFEGAASMDDLR